MNERETKYCSKNIVMRKLNISDANPIFGAVMTSVTKYCLGNFDLFSHFSVSDIEYIQKMICKYTKIKETGESLDLLFLSENLQEFISFLWEFLEFNFGFFSQALKMMSKMGGVILERKDAQKTQETETEI